MAGKNHRYSVDVTWTGNRGTGTSAYREYDRTHEITAAGKPAIPGSSDPAFLGDPTRWNPEELMLAAASACHKLWYLHLAAVAGIRVLEYRDRAEATVAELADGSGHFANITLRPSVTIAAGGDPAKADALHHQAHGFCFIANSVKCAIDCVPATTVAI